MKLCLSLLALVSLAGCSPKTAAARSQDHLARTADFFIAINANADGKAMLDAEPVVQISPGGPCDVVFRTKAGQTTIDWRRSGNLAASRIDGRLLTRLQDNSGGRHVLDAPGGEVGERLQSSIGYLSDLCTK